MPKCSMFESAVFLVMSRDINAKTPVWQWRMRVAGTILDIDRTVFCCLTRR